MNLTSRKASPRTFDVGGSPATCLNVTNWIELAENNCASLDAELVDLVELEACPGGFRYAAYLCDTETEGLIEVLGSEETCYSDLSWQGNASQVCAEQGLNLNKFEAVTECGPDLNRNAAFYCAL